MPRLFKADTLYFKQGTSDKVYCVSTYREDNGAYSVLCKWGRRELALIGEFQDFSTSPFTELNTAIMYHERTLHMKMKKGYARGIELNKAPVVVPLQTIDI